MSFVHALSWPLLHALVLANAHKSVSYSLVPTPSPFFSLGALWSVAMCVRFFVFREGTHIDYDCI